MTPKLSLIEAFRFCARLIEEPDERKYPEEHFAVVVENARRNESATILFRELRTASRIRPGNSQRQQECAERAPLTALENFCLLEPRGIRVGDPADEAAVRRFLATVVRNAFLDCVRGGPIVPPVDVAAIDGLADPSDLWSTAGEPVETIECLRRGSTLLSSRILPQIREDYLIYLAECQARRKAELALSGRNRSSKLLRNQLRVVWESQLRAHASEDESESLKADLADPAWVRQFNNQMISEQLPKPISDLLTKIMNRLAKRHERALLSARAAVREFSNANQIDAETYGCVIAALWDYVPGHRGTVFHP